MRESLLFSFSLRYDRVQRGWEYGWCERWLWCGWDRLLSAIDLVGSCTWRWVLKGLLSVTWKSWGFTRYALNFTREVIKCLDVWLWIKITDSSADHVRNDLPLAFIENISTDPDSNGIGVTLPSLSSLYLRFLISKGQELRDYWLEDWYLAIYYLLTELLGLVGLVMAL